MTVQIDRDGGSFVLKTETVIPEQLEVVFSYFGDATNLGRLTPPFLHFRILTPEPIEMRVGTLIDYRLRLHGVPIRWRTIIRSWEPPFRFVDEQLRGPYRKWSHTHEFEAIDDERTRMRDTVRYQVPLAFLTHRWLVRPDLERVFQYRQDVIQREFAGQGNARVST